MVDKKIEYKEAQGTEKDYNQYLDKRSDFMKITQFKVEDIFSDTTPEILSF